MKSKTDKIIIIYLLIFVVLECAVHRKVVFMMDDFWYATNLVTGEPLSGIKDVLQSQAWHFMNWGGRNISHGVLQLLLMSDELCADILNIIVTFTLSYLICELADAKKVMYFCAVFFMLISLNGDVKLSMFWQAGSANYLYCTNWILLFIIIYLRQVKKPDAPALRGIVFWILPLGLISGWSNENMGPASFVCIFCKVSKKKGSGVDVAGKCSFPIWQYFGSSRSRQLCEKCFCRRESVFRGGV